jgi:RNA ligase
MTLHYNFPENITLDEVRDIIKDNPNFILVDKGDYTVANYVRSGNDTHPPVIDRNTAILRELRGLIFDSFTGKIISRRYQKFFNLGEREDVTEIDVTQKHIILTKLDGSMITPIKTSNGNLYWGTKMGVTDVSKQVDKFLIGKNNYIEFVNLCIDNDLTPIFEWVSNEQRIVLDYPVSDLVLVAIRHNYNGSYLPYTSVVVNAMRYSINYVPSYDIKRLNSDNPNHLHTDINAFINRIKSLENEEGGVIRFDNGHMVKVKSDWYVSLHRAKSLLDNERDVVGIVLDNGEDDLYGLLSDNDKSRLKQFVDDVWRDIFEFTKIVNVLYDYTSGMTRKEFAINTMKLSSSYRAICFIGFDKQKIEVSDVVKYIKKKLGSNRTYDQVRDIIKIKWKEIKLDDG